MVIHCPNFTHIIPNLSPLLILGGLIFGRIFELVYRGLYSGVLIVWKKSGLSGNLYYPVPNYAEHTVSYMLSLKSK